MCQVQLSRHDKQFKNLVFWGWSNLDFGLWVTDAISPWTAHGIPDPHGTVGFLGESWDPLHAHPEERWVPRASRYRKPQGVARAAPPSPLKAPGPPRQYPQGLSPRAPGSWIGSRGSRLRASLNQNQPQGPLDPAHSSRASSRTGSDVLSGALI